MQIHEYKDKYKHNTQIQFRWKLSKVCYSFGMIMVQGSQKLICWVSDMQIDNTNTLIQIYKYKIHFWWILPIDPTYAIFLEWLWASVYNRYSAPLKDLIPARNSKLYINPPSVGMIYTISTYIFK